jgi:hypothetical protein
MGLFSSKPKTWMWMCSTCRTGGSNYATLRDCEKDQVKHAKRKHSRQPGYSVSSRGRVIYRVP